MAGLTMEKREERAVMGDYEEGVHRWRKGVRKGNLLWFMALKVMEVAEELARDRNGGCWQQL